MFIQGFHDVTGGLFAGLDEIPRGWPRVCFNRPGDRGRNPPRLGTAPAGARRPHAGIVGPNLSAPDPTRCLVHRHPIALQRERLLFEIPAGLGRPARRRTLPGHRTVPRWWVVGHGAGALRLPAVDRHPGERPPRLERSLAETVLLLYKSSENTRPSSAACEGYQHPDEWEGGAFITDGTRTVRGSSSPGPRGPAAESWYRWSTRPALTTPAWRTSSSASSTVCRLADGSPCPTADLHRVPGPQRLPRVVERTVRRAVPPLRSGGSRAGGGGDGWASWQPQPYATLDMDDRLFLNPSGVEAEMLGTGVQRRFRLGAVAFNRNRGRLCMLEHFADEAARWCTCGRCRRDRRPRMAGPEARSCGRVARRVRSPPGT